MPKMVQSVEWSAIVLTCMSNTSSSSYRHELELRKEHGLIGKQVILLTVEDPKSQVGSGGATLNALLVVTEHISARRGFSVVTADVLKDSYILIIHAGRNYPYDVCGRPFVTFPAQHARCDSEVCVTHLDLLIHTMTQRVGVGSPPGVWVCSTEMMLNVVSPVEMDWSDCDAVVMTTREGRQACRQHGIYQIDEKGYVEDIFYQAGDDVMDKCATADGSLPIVCGIVYLSQRLCNRLLSLHVQPLDRCTYLGQDNGHAPLQLSIFFDIMLPMAANMDEALFVSGERGARYSRGTHTGGGDDAVKVARALLWNALHSLRMKACILEGGSYHYMGHSGHDHLKYLLSCPVKGDALFTNHTLVSIDNDAAIVSGNAVLINSLVKGRVTIRQKSALSHCSIKGDVTVGKSCLLLSVFIDNNKKSPVYLPDNVVLEGMRLNVGGVTRHVYMTHGVFDKLFVPVSDPLSTFLNEPWSSLTARTGILLDDLWPVDTAPQDRTLYTARLYPVLHATDTVTIDHLLWLITSTLPDHVLLSRWRLSWRLSLEEMLGLVDIPQEFKARRELFYRVSEARIEENLEGGGHIGFTSLYRTAYIEGFCHQLLQHLDRVALQATSPGVVARTLANIADVLGCMANGQGGLRSGPAANKSWMKAFSLIEAGKTSKGIQELSEVRSEWLSRPDLLIRASRHYEGAAQLFVRQAVSSARKYFTTRTGEAVPMGAWVKVECPARMDMAGGWSDTPPICYEHGGVVTNLALLVNGTRPICAKVRRIPEPQLVLVSEGHARLVIKSTLDMLDYNQPTAPGALLKCVFICAGIVDIESDVNFPDQLIEDHGGGYELHTWTNLPRGSGLGTSSILAGAAIHAVITASGRSITKDSLYHAVLHLEQLMTTGGGWQDAVGGCDGGAKCTVSEATLPLRVNARRLPLDRSTVNELNERILLIYSGQTRLAKNLVQEVVRTWYARTPDIVRIVDELVELGNQSGLAFLDGNIEKIGSILNDYWLLKKRMAAGSEPAIVRDLMAALKPYCHGMSLAGAGGGGFLFVIMKDKCHFEAIQQALVTVQEHSDVALYEAKIDEVGMVISIDDSSK